MFGHFFFSGVKIIGPIAFLTFYNFFFFSQHSQLSTFFISSIQLLTHFPSRVHQDFTNHFHLQTNKGPNGGMETNTTPEHKQVFLNELHETLKRLDPRRVYSAGYYRILGR